MASTPESNVPISGQRQSLRGLPHVSNLGANIERGMVELGNGLGKERGAQIAEQMRIERNRIETEAIGIQTEAFTKAQQAPSSSAVMDTYTQGTQKLAELAEQVPEGVERDIFTARAERRRLAQVAALDNSRFAKLTKESAIDFTNKVNAQRDAVAVGGENELAEALDAVDADLAERVEMGVVSPEGAEAEQAEAYRVLELGLLAGMEERQEYDAALAVLDSGMLGNLTPEDRANAVGGFRSKRSNRLLTDYQVALDGGADPVAMRAAILRDRESGRLTEGNTRTALNMADAAARAGAEAVEIGSLLSTFEETGVLPDHLPAKMKDKVVTASYMRFREANPEMSDVDASVQFARQRQRVPQAILGEVSGRIRSADASVREHGHEWMEQLDVAAGGNFGDVQGPAGVAFGRNRHVQRLMYGAPRASQDASIAPLMSRRDAMVLAEQEMAEGTSETRTVARDAVTQRVLESPEVIDSAIAANRGLWHMARDFIGFGQDVRTPAMDSLIARRVAARLAAEKAAGDVSDERLGSVIDTVVAEGFQNEAWGVTEFKGEPQLTFGAPEVMLEELTNDAGEPIGYGGYRTEIGLTVLDTVAKASNDAGIRGAFAREIALMTDTSNATSLSFLQQEDGVRLHAMVNEVALHMVADRPRLHPAQAADLGWRAVNEAFKTGLDNQRWEPEFVPDFVTLDARKKGTAPAWRVVARLDDGRRIPLRNLNTDVAGMEPLRLGFHRPEELLNPFVRERAELLSPEERADRATAQAARAQADFQIAQERMRESTVNLD